MAGIYGIAEKSGITTTTSLITLIQVVAAANHAIKIKEFGVSFAGVVATDVPILVQLARQTTAGTATALTTVTGKPTGDTLDTTAQHTATVEPTTTDVLRSYYVHPQTGGVWPVDDAAPIDVGAAGKIAIRVTAPVSVLASAYIAFEE